MFQETLYAKKDFLKTGSTRVSPERITWVKKESGKLLTKNILARDQAKERIFVERKERDLITEAVREERNRIWRNKTKNSPFAVDLVAETERIHEEGEIRTKEEQERRNRIESRRFKAKNDLILKVISCTLDYCVQFSINLLTLESICRPCQNFQIWKLCEEKSARLWKKNNA